MLESWEIQAEQLDLAEGVIICDLGSSAPKRLSRPLELGVGEFSVEVAARPAEEAREVRSVPPWQR